VDNTRITDLDYAGDVVLFIDISELTEALKMMEEEKNLPNSVFVSLGRRQRYKIWVPGLPPAISQ